MNWRKATWKSNTSPAAPKTGILRARVALGWAQGCETQCASLHVAVSGRISLMMLHLLPGHSAVHHACLIVIHAVRNSARAGSSARRRVQKKGCCALRRTSRSVNLKVDAVSDPRDTKQARKCGPPCMDSSSSAEDCIQD